MTDEQIFNEAHMAGMRAAAQENVIPMTVVQRENPLDDNSPVVQSWFIPDGICGFASVWVKPANSRFAKFFKTKGARKSSLFPGIYYSIYEFNQSYQLKNAYAHAFAEVLKNNGINAWAESRMD